MDALEAEIGRRLALISNKSEEIAKSLEKTQVWTFPPSSALFLSCKLDKETHSRLLSLFLRFLSRTGGKMMVSPSRKPYQLLGRSRGWTLRVPFVYRNVNVTKLRSYLQGWFIPSRSSLSQFHTLFYPINSSNKKTLMFTISWVIQFSLTFFSHHTVQKSQQHHYWESCELPPFHPFLWPSLLPSPFKTGYDPFMSLRPANLFLLSPCSLYRSTDYY